MNERPNRNLHQSSRRRGTFWLGASAVCAALILFAAPCDFSQSQTQQPLANPQPLNTSITLPIANHMPDANDIMKINEAHAHQASFEAANIERKRQITQDSTDMVRLATELKADIEKTSKDTLSLDVIRKAEEIEHLAHNIQVKMKLTVNVN